jgi:ribosomal protein S18 acetylase RimI-like enzyme/L-amino acid N-acyltransferase YncA
MTEMDFSIRTMTEDDLAAVAEIEAGVFTDWYRVHRRESEPLPERTIEELRYSTSLDPRGNFVAVSAEGALVGFILSRLWGTVGWFGTFGVPTQLQGLGIGRALVARTVEHLRESAAIVGLETMPESGANIGLYSKAGFTVGQPTVLLELSLVRLADRLRGHSDGGVVDWARLDRSARKRLLAGFSEISDSILPGLDYRVEMEAFERHRRGHTLAVTGAGGRPDGFVILRTAAFRRQDTSGRAYVHALAVRPGADAEAVFQGLLRAVWTVATRVGLARVVAGVSGRYPDALELAIQNGFRCVRTAVRMIDRRSPAVVFERSSAVELSRWAG